MKLVKAIILGIFAMTDALSISRRGFFATSPTLLSLSLSDSESDQQESASTFLQEESNKIYFYGQVSPQTCFILKNQINQMTEKSKKFANDYSSPPFPIHLHIQSGGGSLFPVIYIVDLIKNQPENIPIYTFIDGFAASAATLLSVAGHKRYMTKNSLMLIHQLSAPTDSGKYNELKDQMQNMDSLMKIIVRIYKDNTNITDTDLLYLLQKDIWLNSTECLYYGLVDEVI